MAKQHVSPIIGERVSLRLLIEADLPMTLAWRNQDHIRKWFFHSDVISWEQHQHWCTQYFQRDDDFIFVIEAMTDFHRPVGQIALYRIAWEQRRAEYGRLLIGAPDAVGKGLAKEATALLLAFAFRTLGLEEIELAVFKTNRAAIAIYQACGFREVSEHAGLTQMLLRSPTKEHEKGISERSLIPSFSKEETMV